MVAVDPVHHQHQQQQQHHQQHQHQQQSDISANQGGNISNHQPTNDTAFPGGHHRQNYNIGAPQQMLQNHLNTKITGDNKGNTATMTKNKLYTEENGQVNLKTIPFITLL